MKINTCQQGTRAWFAARRGLPTASDMSRIITPAKAVLSAGATPYACELLGQLVDPDYGNLDTFATAQMRNGILNEPTARAWYEMEIGQEVRQVGICISDDGLWGASPDAIVGTDGGLELKSPMPKTHIGYLVEAAENEPGWIPLEHKCQVHAQLIICEFKWVSFVSYCSGLPPLHVKVVPNEFTEKMRLAMVRFQEIYAEVKRLVPVTPLEFKVDDVEEKPLPTEAEAVNSMF